MSKGYTCKQVSVGALNYPDGEFYTLLSIIYNLTIRALFSIFKLFKIFFYS